MNYEKEYFVLRENFDSLQKKYRELKRNNKENYDIKLKAKIFKKDEEIKNLKNEVESLKKQLNI